MDSSSMFCSACGAANQPSARFCMACGYSLHAAPAHPTRFLPPTHVLKTRYSVLRTVGKGGFGAVYLAEDTRLGNRLVAVKELNQDGLDPQNLLKAIENFQSEARTLAGLRHAGLPSIHDSFEEDGRWYLVMEFIEGDTLDQYVRAAQGGYLPLQEVIGIGLQLSSVLGYLHARQPPIIFRDLKPSNVMRTPGGQVYLIDFGIARRFKQGQSRDTESFGTTGYAAPEQFGRAQTDARTDVYALGALIHHLLSGHDPADNDIPFHFPALPKQPPDLQALITGMLEVDPARRPASMLQVMQVLQSLSALPAPPGARYAISSALGPGLAAPGATLYTFDGHASSVLFVAWSPNGKRIASSGEDGTVQVWEPESGNALSSRKSGRGNAAVPLAWSPNGKRIASAEGTDKYVVWNASTGRQVVAYNGHSNAVTGLAWSPDGKYIASGSGDTSVDVWGQDEDEGCEFSCDHEEGVTAVAWSPDGTYIASASADGTAMVWDADDGKEVSVYNGHDEQVHALAWSPDSNKVASAGKDYSVDVWDPMDGEQFLTFSEHRGEVFDVAWSPDGKYIASASEDGTAMVWDPGSGDVVLTYPDHATAVYCVAWSPDGRYIATGGGDQRVRIWQAPQ